MYNKICLTIRLKISRIIKINTTNSTSCMDIPAKSKKNLNILFSSLSMYQ